MLQLGVVGASFCASEDYVGAWGPPCKSPAVRAGPASGKGVKTVTRLVRVQRCRYSDTSTTSTTNE